MYRLQQQIQGIERLAPYHFSHECWRAGSLTELGIQTRTYSIEQNRQKIRNCAIGYLRAEDLWVRPKRNEMAVMFWFKEEHFWTHLTSKEFEICFPELRGFTRSTKS